MSLRSHACGCLRREVGRNRGCLCRPCHLCRLGRLCHLCRRGCLCRPDRRGCPDTHHCPGGERAPCCCQFVSSRHGRGSRRPTCHHMSDHHHGVHTHHRFESRRSLCDHRVRRIRDRQARWVEVLRIHWVRRDRLHAGRILLGRQSHGRRSCVVHRRGNLLLLGRVRRQSRRGIHHGSHHHGSRRRRSLRDPWAARAWPWCSCDHRDRHQVAVVSSP